MSYFQLIFQISLKDTPVFKKKLSLLSAQMVRAQQRTYPRHTGFEDSPGLTPITCHRIWPMEKIAVANDCTSNMKKNIYMMYSYMTVRWNLSWETTATRDHLSWQTTHFWQKDLHFSIMKPVTRDHLSWQTTFLWPKGWSFKTGFTVVNCRLHNEYSCGMAQNKSYDWLKLLDGNFIDTVGFNF